MNDTPAYCRDVHEHASWFVDGEATGPTWDRIRAHLEKCPPCVEYVRQIGLTVEVLRQLPGEEGREERARILALFDAWTAKKQD